NQEVKEIKEIPEPEFVSFLQALHCWRFEFTSVIHALDTLGLADRFIMPRISKKVLPYLKCESLPEYLLEYAFIVADRVSCTEDLLVWIMTQFNCDSKLIEIVRSTALSLSNDSIQTFFEQFNRRRRMQIFVKTYFGRIVTLGVAILLRKSSTRSRTRWDYRRTRRISSSSVSSSPILACSLTTISPRNRLSI
ncbi:hypothetical protein PFISCL1PPCAC_25544, partial [Pristionchus fissidentatus]